MKMIEYNEVYERVENSDDDIQGYREDGSLLGVGYELLPYINYVYYILDGADASLKQVKNF